MEKRIWEVPKRQKKGDRNSHYIFVYPTKLGDFHHCDKTNLKEEHFVLVPGLRGFDTWLLGSVVSGPSWDRK